MKQIIFDEQNRNQEYLYIQLYQEIKEQILSGEIAPREKFPSLRVMAHQLQVSVTTVDLAYSQLVTEGYAQSRPGSGYYALDIGIRAQRETFLSASEEETFTEETKSSLLTDTDSFDFGKWKKCASRIYTAYSDALLYESDPQGEPALRKEISRYLYLSRGVQAPYERIVIGAGTQQITSHLSRILKMMDIRLVCLESPGYLPVQNMFAEAGFTLSHIPVKKDGIAIEKLPTNLSSAVYVSPSNQFPTGALMPVGRRNELLGWAKANDSIIIEDDYDSELRYFGKPVSALKSLDSEERVVYLGSFTSTLFRAIKISYMVLPPQMMRIFDTIKDRYMQTCSKAEQLTLAVFMHEGYYATGIRKRRALYSIKLQATLEAFSRYAKGFVTPSNTSSGLSLVLHILTDKSTEELLESAANLGLSMVPTASLTDQETTSLSFYYSRLPLSQIDPLIKRLISRWS